MRILTVLLVLGLMTISPLVFAGEPAIKHLGDILTADNDYLETNIYVAKTISLEKTPYLNVLNADLRVKLSTPIGDGFVRSGILEVGLEF